MYDWVSLAKSFEYSNTHQVWQEFLCYMKDLKDPKTVQSLPKTND